MADWSRVPGREWEWREASATAGVHTNEAKLVLVWWRRPDGPSGYMTEVGREQSFDEFVADGALVNVPLDISEQVRAFLEGHRR